LIAWHFAVAELDGVERGSQKCPGDDQRAKDRQTDISFRKNPHGFAYALATWGFMIRRPAAPD
jgi:hypothetical protein